MDRKKIATLFDSNHNDDSEDRQAFYAGGSERSGQQILGPPGSSDRAESADGLVDNLFSEAQRIALQGSDSEQRASDGIESLPIRFWRNGFTIGNGAVRSYTEPANQQFLDHLKRGETPPELIKLMRGGMVDVKLESRRHEDYREPSSSHVVAFSGEGHRLGNPTPETVEEDVTSAGPSASARKSPKLKVDESQPMTNVQIRLPNNQRLVARVNLTHRIGDLVNFVRDSCEELHDVEFVLATTFPARELSELEQTVDEVNLKNSNLVVRRKR